MNIQFSSIGEFLQMGGYAFNVWSVYFLFLLFFGINLYLPVLKKKQIIREQRRRLQFNTPDGLVDPPQSAGAGLGVDHETS